MKKRMIVLAAICIALAGCGADDSEAQTKEDAAQVSSEYNSEEETRAKPFRDLYDTQELCVVNLGDIGFKIPERFTENRKESGECKR